MPINYGTNLKCFAESDQAMSCFAIESSEVTFAVNDGPWKQIRFRSCFQDFSALVIVRRFQKSQAQSNASDLKQVRSRTIRAQERPLMGEGSLTIDQIQGIGGLRRSDDLFWLSEFRP